MTKHRWLDIPLFFIIGSLFALAINLAIFSTTILQASGIFIYSVGLAFLVLFFFVFYNRYTCIISYSVLALVCFVIAVGEPFAQLRQFMYDTFQFARGYLPYDVRYEMPIIITILMTTSLFTSIFLYVTFHFYLLAAFGFAAFSLSWLMNYQPPRYSFLVFLFCFCFFLAKELNLNSMMQTKHRNEKASLHNGVFSLYTIPISLVLVLIITLLPLPAASQTQDLMLRGPLARVTEFLYASFYPKYFSFQSYGITGNNSRLGGSVALNSNPVMEVTTNARPYLTGVTYNTYTGHSWQTDTAFDSPQTIDTNWRPAEFVTNDRNRDRVVTFEDVTIHIGKSRTYTLFYPLRITDFPSLADDLVLQVNRFGDMRTRSLMPADTSYQFSYQNMDYTNSIIQDIMRSPSHYFAGAFYPYSQRYISDVQDNFTDLPESLPKRVYDLAYDITANEQTDYDKATAIETYLSQFPYTLTPESVPRDSDFVDYFLFEGKEGYCTYYASAMAVLARCIGLPSRYVEGFSLPASKNSNGRYTVTNRQAHAWAEVFFESVGWVVFEATAPHYYVRYNRTASSEQPVFSQSYMEQPGFEDYRDEMGFDHITPGIAQSAQTESPQAYDALLAGLRFFLICLLVVVMIALILGIVLAIRYTHIQRQERKMLEDSPNQQIIRCFQKIIRITAYYRYPVRMGETYQSYAQRIGKRFAFRNDTIFIRDLTKVFYKAKYSGIESTESERILMWDAYRELLRFIYTMRPTPVYVWNRYFLKKI